MVLEVGKLSSECRSYLGLAHANFQEGPLLLHCPKADGRRAQVRER